MSSPMSHALQAVFATGAIILADSAVDPTALWAATIEKFGLAVTLVLFFIWTGWEREKRMGKRIDKLEGQSNTQMSKVAQLTELVSEALRRDNDVISKMAETLASRTCVAFGSHEEFVKWQGSQANDGK